MKVIDQCFGENWVIYNGDCCDALKGIPDNKIHYSLYSPPFSQLFCYSNSLHDLGNSKSDEEFQIHYQFMVKELYRVLMPGRLVSIHCMNIPAMKERDGYIGLKDFRGDMIRAFLGDASFLVPAVRSLRARQQAAFIAGDMYRHGKIQDSIDTIESEMAEYSDTGFIYHSEVCIWKDPLIEATRTKALGLMHKQITKDSTRCRQGLPDYIVTMRKPGDNPEPVTHDGGLKTFYGEDEPEGGVYSHNVWRRYASPIWADIRQGNTLNVVAARHNDDERHLCPLQIDTINRCLELWSNPGDTILSPFAGIGSEGYGALQMGRRFIGIELKPSYFEQAVKNMPRAVSRLNQQQQQLFA